MHSIIRRSAFRAIRTSNLAITRSISSAPSPFLARKSAQISALQISKRWNSDLNNGEESKQDAADQNEQNTVTSAINSAAETASTYASNAAESVSENAQAAKEYVGSAASGAAAAAGIAAQSTPFGDERTPTERLALEPTNSIYIGNILFEITQEDLRREFDSFGEIKKVTIATDVRGLSKGFAYIEFDTVEAATAAVSAKNMTVVEGRRIIVNYQAKTKRPHTNNPPSRTIFVGNLAYEMSDADLNKLFREIRNVIDVRVAIDRRTGQPRGFAHADFVDVESAVKAMEQLQGKEIYGRPLRCDYSGSKTSSERSASRGSSRGSSASSGGSF